MAGMDANEIQRQARNAVRKGSILDVDHGAALCRVSVGDLDDESGSLQTNWIPWFALAAGNTRDWRAPTKGEQVMLLCPMGDPAQGVALCGFYSDAFPAPDHRPNTDVRTYRDGAVVAYDDAAHVLGVDLPAGATINVTAPGAVNVNTQTATIKADRVTLDADVTVTRSMTVEGPFTFESGMTGRGGAAGGQTMRIDGAADFTGEVKSQGISLPHHTHREQGDGNDVSEPK
ncbi:phage baseplate assembly protein V [Burkholderia cepacia]|nr:phage baseplate assembly protein V [Burkholderia cepacia]